MATQSNKLVVLAEEQTMLSRERTMQQYVATGLAFITVGLLVAKFLEHKYILISAILIAFGFWQIWQAYQRFKHYRQIVRRLRKREKKLGLEVGE